jgi:hypothetical protein
MICLMHPAGVNPRLLIVSTAALIGVAWLYIEKEDLQPNLYSAETARGTDAQATATSERADQSQNIKTEQLLADVREELIEAQRARDAAELTLKQAREQLATEKEAIDTSLIWLREKKPTRAERNKRRHSRR